MCTLFCLVDIKKRSFLTSCVFWFVFSNAIALALAVISGFDFLLSQNKDCNCKMSGTVKRLWFVIWWTVYIYIYIIITEMVDWALKPIISLPTYQLTMLAKHVNPTQWSGLWKEKNKKHTQKKNPDTRIEYLCSLQLADMLWTQIQLCSLVTLISCRLNTKRRVEGCPLVNTLDSVNTHCTCMGGTV